MKKYILFLILAVALAALAYPTRLLWKYYLSVCAEEGPARQTDFEMYLEPLDLGEYRQEIFSFRPGFNITVLSTITYRDESYEIYQIDKKHSRASRNLLIFAATHGNEFAGALVIPDLLEDMRAHPSFYENWNIRIVTPINPVGLAYGSRYDQNGCDINRDFQHFSTTGATLQKQAIDEFGPDVIITLHEGPQDGFFMFAEQATPKALENAILHKLQSEKIVLARKSYLGLSLADSGLWHKESFVYALQKLFGIYTLGRYAYDHKLAMLTTESPWASTDVEERKRPHLLVIKTVVESLPTEN